MHTRFPILPLLLICLSVFCSVALHAQKTDRFVVAYDDSVILKEGSRLYSNSVKFSNPNDQDVVIGIAVDIPENWKSIRKIEDDDYSSVILKKGEPLIVALNLVQRRKIVARWDSLRIRVWQAFTNDTFYYYPTLKIDSKPEYTIEALNEYQVFVAEKPDVLLFKYLVTNTGNVADFYTVSCKHSLLHINYSAKFSLEPGKDTTLVYGAKFSNFNWRSLYQDNINLQIASQQLPVNRYISFKISRPLSSLAQNKESHKVIPLTMGGGMMLNGDMLTYFGQVRANINFGAHYFSFDYKTRDFGPFAYTYQQNIFNFSYVYKNFQLAAGQIIGPKNFFTIGQGASIRYENVRKNTGFYLSAIKHNERMGMSSYMNDNIYGGLHYKVGKVILNHLAESNFDNYYKVNSYLLSNEVIVFNKKDLGLKMFGGIGLEHNQNISSAPPLGDLGKGYAGGYAFNMSRKFLQVSSTIQYNSPDYPGIYKGIYSHNHMVGFLKNHFLYSINYFSNVTTRNTLRDTLFSSDYLRINSTKYGVGVSYSKDGLTCGIAAGQITQQGGFAYIDDGKYADGSLRLMLNHTTNIMLTSANAFQQQRMGDPIYITNSGLRFNSKSFTLYGMFNRVPIPSENKIVTNYLETIHGGPTINFGLFNSAFVGSIRYDISKTLSETRLRNGIGAQFNFYNQRSGVQLNFNGFYPLRDPTSVTIPVAETKYAQLTFNKRIDVPIRKYELYDIKVVLFSDDNDNGRPDKQEAVMANTMVRIDDKVMISDSRGRLEYRNAKPGIYQIGLLDLKVSNLVPVNGFVQSVDLTEDRDVFIAFKKGRKIEGNIRIDRDSLSSVGITAERFKISITDSVGRTYNTISDKDGNFYSYVPEGTYTVYINPNYFIGTDFKLERNNFEHNMFTNEKVFVQFVIKQKKRTVRFLDADKK